LRENIHFVEIRLHVIPRNPSIILAFGFANLAMLGWLAAAAAPLLIHLWSRRRFREAPWAAMQFLLAAMRKNARRLQLQQWLLLAVRTLLIMLVVLALAEPYGERVVAGGASAPAHKVLVIDGSLSMAYRDGRMSRFERAKELAVDLVRESRAADKFTVILMTSPAKTIVGRETVDHSTVVAQIEALTQSHTTAELTSALELIDNALQDDSAEGKPIERQEVYFFTDLQRATWQQASASDDAPIGNTKMDGTGIKERLSSLAERASVCVIDVGATGDANLAVTGLTVAEPFVTAGGEVSFDVALHMFGQAPRPECNVELLVDDVPVAEYTVDVPAGGEATGRFTHRIGAPGAHTICARATSDNLDVDNSRWLVVPVREEVRVLCVAGREGAARYVADALDPNPDAPSAIRPVVVSEGDLPELSLADFDCVFMCNVTQLGEGEARRLTDYVAAGGGVVFFVGDRVVPESYNAYASNESPLVPARIGELITEPQFGIDPLDYRHPIVAPFRGRERAGLLTTPVTRYYRLDASDNRPVSEMAAATRGGDPFIVTGSFGRGRTVLVATDGSLSSVDPTTGEPWTSWPTWPSFLPIVREMLAYAAGGPADEWQQLVGTSLGGELSQVPANSSDADEKRLHVVRPDGRSDPVAVQLSVSPAQWSYNDTNLSGIYSLRGMPPGKSQQFAVNVDNTESDLTRMNARDLPADITVRDTHTRQKSADTVVESLQTYSAWSGPLLWMAVSLLFLESFLAWRFGRGAA
jgi:hypothetical protein